MCLALVACQTHPRLPLILAANRDEFHARPTAPLGWWDGGMLAGRDLQAGGTWLGFDRRGRMALVTNYRDPAQPDSHGPSRGSLVVDFLAGDLPADAYARKLVARAGEFAGFNLLLRDGTGLHYVGSQPEPLHLSLPPGVYALSNHRLDTNWPKIAATRPAFAGEVAAGAPRSERLFGIMSDRRRAPDGELPDTGVGLELERMLSPPFIADPVYGTRSTTVALLSGDGLLWVEERRHATDGGVSGRTRIVTSCVPAR